MLSTLKMSFRYIYISTPDLRGARGPGPGPPTMFTCLGTCATYACLLVIFSEKSLFVDAIKLSVGQTAVFYLKNIL